MCIYLLRNVREFGFKYHIYMCNIHLGIMFLSHCGFGKEMHRFFVLYIFLFIAFYIQFCKSYISFNSTLWLQYCSLTVSWACHY